MSRKFWQSIFSIMLLVGLLLGGLQPSGVRAGVDGNPATQTDILANVEAQVLDELDAESTTDFFIWMTEKADLSPASQLATQLEKGQFVFDTLRVTADRTQADLKAFLDAQSVEYRAFYIANKILVKNGDMSLLMAVAVRPDVAQITANHQFQLQEPFKNTVGPDTPAAVEPNISFINADDVWALGYNGQGTVMAGNDTGLDETHPTISRHYRGCLNPPTCSSWDHNYNWWDATGTYPNDPYDGHGHGTHTTGTMVGDDGGTNQIGVAPGALTVHCKNMTDGGSGDDAGFTECFEWDLAPWDLTGFNADPSMAPDAINNSWGYWGGGAPQFEDEIAALHAAGILVEVSAGNEGSSCSTLRSPGDYLQVLTTGSINHASTFPGTVTGFSSRGPSSLYPGEYFPDIMAPGENIRSSLPGGTYGNWGGTSMAGPHATALIGLMWSACPTLQGMVTQTLDIIHQTAVPIPGYVGSCGGNYTTGPNNDWGFGTIDALAAVQEAILQCGGIGTLEGTVIDSVTSDPISGATVLAERDGGGSKTVFTDGFGEYTMLTAEGIYTVTASHMQYMADFVTGVVVITDTTTIQNFALDPRGLLWGYVTDFDGGFPLEGATVTADDGTWATTDATGYYEMYLDEGTFDVTATLADYAPETESVVIVSGDDTQQDFVLQAAVGFTPSPAEITLAYGTTDSLAATLINRQPTAYDFRFAERYEGFIPGMLGYTTVTIPAGPSEAPAGSAVASGPYTPAPERSITIPSVVPMAGENVLLVCSDNLPLCEPILSQLVAFGDLGLVDAFNAQTATPSLALLEVYDVVLTWTNFVYSDPIGMGNVLADYVDGGGKVINLMFAMGTHGWQMGGRFMTDGYTAMNGTNLSFATVCLGTYDAGHPIMEGVTNVCEYYRMIGTYLTADSTAVANWADGQIFVAAKDDQTVVTINGYVGSAALWTGQMDEVVHNAILWLAGGGGGVPWFGAIPITGTVPAESTLPVTLEFTATAAVGVNQPGDYLATLRVLGDPDLEVPVVMTVLPAATWGELTGNISDACTGLPIEAVEILITGGDPITQTWTDASGNYSAWLEEGTYSVDFIMAGYPTYSTSVDIEAGETLTLNLELVPDRPCIVVEPVIIEVWVLTGTVEYDSDGFDISNPGSMDLNFEIRERDGGFTPTAELPVTTIAPLPPVDNPGTTSVLDLTDAYGSVEFEPASPEAWTGAAPYPGTIVRYAKVQCEGDFNSFYIIGGVDNGSVVTALHRFDADTNSWATLASIPSTDEGTGGVCYEGKIYANGGGYTAVFYIYDIASNSWTTGATPPRAAEMASWAAMDGSVYMIGGDDDFNPGTGVSDQVNIYDIATNTWVGNGASMPVGVGNAGFVQLGSQVYIVGGWWPSSPGTNSNLTLRYDIEADLWETGPTFTPARADVPMAATSQYLYIMGGDQDGGGFWDSSNVVWRYDFNAWPAGTWVDVSDPLPYALQAHAGGFTTTPMTGGEVWSVGGLEGASFIFHGDNLYRAAEPPWTPTPADVPWVWEDPISGTVAAGGMMHIDVSFTALYTDTTPMPLGTYTAELRVLNNDSVAGVQTVQVIMHIIDAYWQTLPLIFK